MLALRPSDNVIEQTWLAFAFDRRESERGLERRLAMVGDHYSGLIADRVELRRAGDGCAGLALWSPRDQRLRWPLWIEAGSCAMASTAVPTGWGRLTGDAEVEAAAVALPCALAADPARAVELNPPFVIGIWNREDRSALILNDLLGAGRLYEMRFAGGTVWSNRLGALPLFAGRAPERDRRAWAVFAAAGWFLGEMTPIREATKIRPGTAIRIATDSSGARVAAQSSDAARRAVEPRRARLRRSTVDAAGQAVGMAADLGAAWRVPLAISLTGGRDSRISAAAALSAGIDATFNTGDQVPGEGDVVRELVRRSPVAIDHSFYTPDAEEDEDADLSERIRRIHLVHDGMRNPQEVRRPTELPHRRRVRPTLSGHGGELGHGFYYSDAAKLRRLRRGRHASLIGQLERNARRRHSAGTDEAYAIYLQECERTLAEGRGYGLRGPVLLDWFYMAQRLPYRSGLGARSGRTSACATPAFVRGAFDLRPKDRLGARLHREVVSRLVPEWGDVPFFRSDEVEQMPAIHRRRIWQRPREASAVEEMISAREGWPEMFDPRRVEAMWKEVRSGGGSADYEHVFYRLVWRVGFERHLRDLEREISAPPNAATARPRR